MDARTTQIERGWSVVGSDGGKIGEIEEVREDHIIVTRGMIFKHNLYIPTDHLTGSGDGQVTVNVQEGYIDEEGWRYPPNAGFEHERPAYPEVPETTSIQAAGMSAGRLSAPEPQGALKDDGMIDPGEVPNADLEPDDSPHTVEDEENDR